MVLEANIQFSEDLTEDMSDFKVPVNDSTAQDLLGLGRFGHLNSDQENIKAGISPLRISLVQSTCQQLRIE